MSPDTGYIVPHPEKWTAFERHSLETWVESYCPPNAREALLSLLAEVRDGSKYKALWNAASEAASSFEVAIDTHMERAPDFARWEAKDITARRLKERGSLAMLKATKPKPDSPADLARFTRAEFPYMVASLTEALKALNEAVNAHQGANDR